MNPALLELFKDSFTAHFIFTFHEEIGFQTALHFQSAEIYILCVVAVLGSGFGLLASFIFFDLIARMLRNFLEKSHNYQPLKDFMSKYPYLVLFITAFPNFSVIGAFFGGMARMSILKFMFFVLIFRSIYYGIIIY
jgi:membrane protein YqaA with SNARE-associated domain